MVVLCLNPWGRDVSSRYILKVCRFCQVIFVVINHFHHFYSFKLNNDRRHSFWQRGDCILRGRRRQCSWLQCRSPRMHSFREHTGNFTLCYFTTCFLLPSPYFWEAWPRWRRYNVWKRHCTFHSVGRKPTLSYTWPSEAYRNARERCGVGRKFSWILLRHNAHCTSLAGSGFSNWIRVFVIRVQVESDIDQRELPCWAKCPTGKNAKYTFISLFLFNFHLCWYAGQTPHRVWLIETDITESNWENRICCLRRKTPSTYFRPF